MTKPLDMWTIYHKPDDYPDEFVARRWEILIDITATNDMFVADTLEELRALLPPGLVCLHRQPLDDPRIVEVWL